jgi:siroheme synthase-like protein
VYYDHNGEWKTGVEKFPHQRGCCRRRAGKAVNSVPLLPLFVSLEGRICLLVGGGTVAARKAQPLIDFGASLVVVDPEPSEEIRSLEGRGQLTVHRRAYAGSIEMDGAALVIAATDDRELNRRVARDANSAGIPVNVSDAPELCGFFFPALVRRGNLVAGISTSGDCPALAARLRRQLDEFWPQNLDKILEHLKAERQRLRQSSNPGRTLKRLDALITELLGRNRVS